MNEKFIKGFLEMVLVLIPQHNVHQMHIIPVLLIMILMLFGKNDEKYDLLIMTSEEVCEIVLQHKIQHAQHLSKYEIIIYNVHAVMHVMQLNLILFKGNVNYDLKILKLNKTVRLLHITIGGFLILKKEKKNNYTSNNSNTKHPNDTV